MKSFDLNKIESELRQKATITDKLNYWLIIENTNIIKPLKNKYGKYWMFNYEADKEKKKILTNLFGVNYKPVPSLPLDITEHIYNEHFKDALNEPEFTYWFLKYNAKFYFHIEYKQMFLDEIDTITK